jgi:hypothetical protein
MDTSLMSAQTKRKKVVRLTLPNHKDEMLRQRMLKVETH